MAGPLVGCAGIPDLSALTALTFLRLGTNELSGTVRICPIGPRRRQGLGGAASGRRTCPAHEPLTRAQLPASIGSLTTLQALFLDHLLLNGTVPASFANLKALTTLQMASSGLCGTVPGHQPNDGPLPAC